MRFNVSFWLASLPPDAPVWESRRKKEGCRRSSSGLTFSRLFLVLFLPTISSAEICLVPSAAYTTIQDAVNAVNCDIIDIADGTYPESITVNRQSGSLTLQGSTGNAATVTITGGIRASGSGLKLVVKNLSLTGHSSSENGGGVYAVNLSSVSIESCTIAGNSALLGGGIYADTVSSVSIERSTISGNYASNNGGGIYAVNASSGFIKSSTISGNSALNNGGGIAGYGAFSLSIESCTIYGNSATNGGGISAFNAQVSMVNSILANGSSTSSQCYNSNSGNTWDLGNNLVQDASDSSCSSFFTDSTTLNNNNPMLGPLADNGGPTKTHALLVSSPAVDAGYCPSPTTDQRGVTRPQCLACDIGSFEYKVDPVSFSNVPSPMTVRAMTSTAAVVTYTPPTTTSPYTVACVPPSGSTFSLGTTVVTCTADDPCKSIVTFEVTVLKRTGVCM